MLQELENKNGGSMIWATISNGLIVVKSNENDAKAKSRINKLGNQVWERFYRSIAGVITSINVEENKFGETDIRVGLKNGETNGVLTFKLDSSYGRSFLAQIFNVDFTKMVEFTPWSKVTEDGTKKTRLYLGYGKRQNIEWKLPEGTPEIKWVETKKGKVIDPVTQAEHDDFLDVKLKELIKQNNLEYSNGTITEDEWNEMTVPLTQDEKKELKDLKKNKKEKEDDIESLDDLFN